MFKRLACAAFLVAAFVPSPQLLAQGMPTGTVGWYNGDWKPLIPGAANWHASEQQFARTFDDFAVPEPGWTVAGVFAHIAMRPDDVRQAFWEIRSAAGIYASGLAPAALTHTATVGGGQEVYLLHVSGLSIPLPAGRYWLSVAPVTTVTQTYLCATVGTNAVGEPRGTNGGAYLASPSGGSTPMQGTGSGGTSSDYSLGVLVSGAPASRDLPWRITFAALERQMLAMHSLPFPGITESEFINRASRAAEKAANLSDAQLRTELQALVASIGDPHTDVIWPNPRPFRTLPLSLYWFDDGIYVTAAPERYRQILGGKVVRFGPASIEDVIARLTPLIAHDNEFWLRQQMPGKMLIADFLAGSNLADMLGGHTVQVRTASGALQTGIVSIPERAEPLVQAFQGTPPLYRQHPERNYWATTLDEGATVYFQYNRCAEDPRQASAEFFAELDRMIEPPAVRHLIVDLRNNSGGLTGILNPWFQRLKAGRLNQRGRLYVIIGKATYSAAMEHSNRFREETAAIFVGEPTGAKPRFLLRQGDFPLPFFGIRVSYSCGVQRADDSGPTMHPDIRVPVTFEDYMKGADRALEAIRRVNMTRKPPLKH